MARTKQTQKHFCLIFLLLVCFAILCFNGFWCVCVHLLFSFFFVHFGLFVVFFPFVCLRERKCVKGRGENVGNLGEIGGRKTDPNTLSEKKINKKETSFGKWNIKMNKNILLIILHG